MRFVPNIETCMCVDVYDGDTITIATWFRNNADLHKLYQFSVRIAGIDTPEMKSGSLAQKELALAARDALRDLVLNRPVSLVQPLALDKYGRLLCDVLVHMPTDASISVAAYMLERGYATSYHGGKKWNIGASL
jgi:endonuclease YncB( thermonuclease family)